MRSTKKAGGIATLPDFQKALLASGNVELLPQYMLTGGPEVTVRVMSISGSVRGAVNL